MRRGLLAGLLVGWGVNIVVLLVLDWIFDSIEIGRWGSLLLGAAVLGIANAIIKPILAIDGGEVVPLKRVRFLIPRLFAATESGVPNSQFITS